MEKKLREIISSNIRYYRFSNKLTQEDLGELTGLSSRYISDIENNKGKYYIATNLKELDYYKEKCRLILKKASSLMDIYKVENKDQYKEFLLNGVNEKKDRKRIYSSLPLFTISDKLLKSILKRNNINSDDVNAI